MHRLTLLKTWNDAWTDGLWAAPWSKALSGLTAEEAAQPPAAGRHSIWQIVNHLIFWREVCTLSARGKPSPDKAERERRNWLTPEVVSDKAWTEMQRGFEQSQQSVRGCLEDESVDPKNFEYLAAHDNYHIGQIMQIRAMLGKAPIE